LKRLYFQNTVYLAWSYGSWIYNFLRNQCLSPLTLWVQILLRWGVLDTTLCDKVCQWLAAGWWFSPGTLVSSTNKTDHYDITEILLKVALNIIILTPRPLRLYVNRKKRIDKKKNYWWNNIWILYVFTGKVIESRVYRPKAAWFSVEERFNTEEKPTLCFGETSQVCNKLIYIQYTYILGKYIIYLYKL